MPTKPWKRRSFIKTNKLDTSDNICNIISLYYWYQSCALQCRTTIPQLIAEPSVCCTQWFWKRNRPVISIFQTIFTRPYLKIYIVNSCILSIILLLILCRGGYVYPPVEAWKVRNPNFLRKFIKLVWCVYSLTRVYLDSHKRSEG